MTVQQAADYLEVGPTRVRQLIHAGRIQATRDKWGNYDRVEDSSVHYHKLHNKRRPGPKMQGIVTADQMLDWLEEHGVSLVRTEHLDIAVNGSVRLAIKGAMAIKLTVVNELDSESH